MPQKNKKKKKIKQTQNNNKKKKQKAGHEVLTFEPFFDFYKYQAMHAGANFKTIPLELETTKNGRIRYTFDPLKLEQSINKNTRILILNTVLCVCICVCMCLCVCSILLVFFLYFSIFFSAKKKQICEK